MYMASPGPRETQLNGPLSEGTYSITSTLSLVGDYISDKFVFVPVLHLHMTPVASTNKSSQSFGRSVHMAGCMVAPLASEAYVWQRGHGGWTALLVISRSLDQQMWYTRDMDSQPAPGTR